MKMIDAWGYRLADHPNDKGFRAAYRAVKNNCILQVYTENLVYRRSRISGLVFPNC